MDVVTFEMALTGHHCLQKRIGWDDDMTIELYTIPHEHKDGHRHVAETDMRRFGFPILRRGQIVPILYTLLGIMSTLVFVVRLYRQHPRLMGVNDGLDVFSLPCTLL